MVSFPVLVRMDSGSLEDVMAVARQWFPSVAPHDIPAALALGFGFGSTKEMQVELDQFGGVAWDGVDRGMGAFIASQGETAPKRLMHRLLAPQFVDHQSLADRWHARSLDDCDERATTRRTILLASACTPGAPTNEALPLGADCPDGRLYEIEISSADGGLVFRCGVHARSEALALQLGGRQLGQCWQAVQVGLGLGPSPFPIHTVDKIEVNSKHIWEFGLEYLTLGESLMHHATNRARGKRMLVTTARLRELGRLLISTDPAARSLWSDNAPASFSLRWISQASSGRTSTQISPWPTCRKSGRGLSETTREVLQVMAVQRGCNVRTGRLDGRFAECCDPPGSATLRALLRQNPMSAVIDIAPLTTYLRALGLPSLAQRVQHQAGVQRA
ncbi:hypothetical protein ABIE41_003764 [Bosea sp. OAE506]|uniref:hypothetical protein n=1 Tax=Bosea sp. OAE506 TaxID=2663870 RepID=UPI00178996BC